MRYVGKVYRPPSEADALLLQATLGCSWNRCTYCDMYREKTYAERPADELVAELAHAARVLGPRVEKLFVMDGDALGMPVETWRAVLGAARAGFPRLRRVSCYAMARNVAGQQAHLAELRALGLSRLYMGPESGDDLTLKRIAKGDTFAGHVEAAALVRAAGMELSAIFLLGVGGVERSEEHARASARLLTAMDPAYASALTTTVVPGTPLHRLEARGRFVLPEPAALLRELRILVAEAAPTAAVFRTNHASNYLPIGGVLPRDRARVLAVIDAALEGRVRLRPEGARGLLGAGAETAGGVSLPARRTVGRARCGGKARRPGMCGRSRVPLACRPGPPRELLLAVRARRQVRDRARRAPATRRPSPPVWCAVHGSGRRCAGGSARGGPAHRATTGAVPAVVLRGGAPPPTGCSLGERARCDGRTPGPAAPGVRGRAYPGRSEVGLPALVDRGWSGGGRAPAGAVPIRAGFAHPRERTQLPGRALPALAAGPALTEGTSPPRPSGCPPVARGRPGRGSSSRGPGWSPRSTGSAGRRGSRTSSPRPGSPPARV